MSFIETLHLQSGKAIVSAIIAVADTLAIDVIAEGVQNQEALDFLYQHKCGYYQGLLAFLSAYCRLINDVIKLL